jgi:hypothetical protein
MSVAVPIRGGATKATSAAADRSRRLGRIARCTPDGGGTAVSVLSAAGHVVSVHLAVVPDALAGRRIAGSFRRVSWACIELHDDGPRASVNGLRHRLPVTVPVPVDAALALAQDGVPTVVVAG